MGEALRQFDEDTHGDELSDEYRQQLIECITEIHDRLSTLNDQSALPLNIGVGATAVGTPASFIGACMGIGEATYFASALIGGVTAACGGIAVGATIAIAFSLCTRLSNAHKIKKILNS